MSKIGKLFIYISNKTILDETVMLVFYIPCVGHHLTRDAKGIVKWNQGYP